MAGSDASRLTVQGPAPAVILVEPQLGENIGMAARAMLNAGLTDLRLVRPREGWPNDKAVAAASGADAVLDAATLYPGTAEAIGDLSFVYATTARPRHMTKRVVTPRQAAAELRAHLAAGAAAGILFGKEAKGLHNDDVALADTVLTVPLNPGFASLNLGMAVLLVGYEWFQAGVDVPPSQMVMPKETGPADKAELLALFEHLETELDSCGFLRNREKRPSMVRNLRNTLGRAGLTSQEVRTLRGIITCLVEGPHRRRN
ncbi:MAG: RNA methyltransferase [Rhodospirillales bacterium]|nr:MAG: RNA methyltransferase [Rhodospirillales bacterium]